MKFSALVILSLPFVVAAAGGLHDSHPARLGARARMVEVHRRQGLLDGILGGASPAPAPAPVPPAASSAASPAPAASSRAAASSSASVPPAASSSSRSGLLDPILTPILGGGDEDKTTTVSAAETTGVVTTGLILPSGVDISDETEPTSALVSPLPTSAGSAVANAASSLPTSATSSRRVANKNAGPLTSTEVVVVGAPGATADAQREALNGGAAMMRSGYTVGSIVVAAGMAVGMMMV